MNKKEQYKIENEQFLATLREDSSVKELSEGVLYKIIVTGTGRPVPDRRSVVTCHYKGSLVNGKVFDNSYERSCPEAFRVNDLIRGFQIALMNMRVGDHWVVYIPSSLGYGSRSDGDIPGNSTLVFEIELLNVM